MQSEIDFNNQYNQKMRSKVNQSFQHNAPHSRLLQSADDRPKTAIQNKKFRNHSRKQQIVDLKKSVNLLQAYGEYERFLELSKNFMKEKGISLKKQLKRRKKNKKQIHDHID